LLVIGDLHGNAEDFRRIEELFLNERRRSSQTHLLLLGDLVHAPDREARRKNPALYDYDDGSLEIVRGVASLQRRFPDRLHLLLGNHDHGHIGGPRTSKFHLDEVTHLEMRLDAAQIEAVQQLFVGALLLVAAPCGAIFSHGSPDDSLAELSQLDQSPAHPALRSILGAYGQQPEITARMLQQLSRSSGLDLTLVIHGHDRDEEGYFVESDNQLCPVAFGAPRQNKRYLKLDLAARYASAAALRVGKEILRLYP